MNIIALVFSAFFLSAAFTAQDPIPQSQKQEATPTKSGDKEEPSPKQLTPNQYRALDILSQLSEAAKDFESGEVKIRTQAKIADVLWEYDEPRARKQFEESFSSIDALSSNRLGENNQLRDGNRQFKLRSEILSLLTQRDPAFAKKLADTITVQLLNGSKNTSAQTMSLLQMALGLAEADPTLAVKIAQSGLSKGMDSASASALTQFLITLRHKDPIVADNLCGYALTLIQRDPVSLVRNLDWLAIYVFSGYGSPAARMNLGLDDQPASATQVNPGLIQSFLNVTQAVIGQQIGQINSLAMEGDERRASSQAAFLYYFTQQMLRYYDQYMPSQGNAIRAKSAQIRQYIQKDLLERLPSSGPSATSEDRLSLVESAKTAQEKDSLYTQLIVEHLSKGEFDLAIARAEKMSDTQMRARWQSTARYKAALNAIGKGDFDAAYRFAKEIITIHERAFAFAQLAKAIGRKKDHTRAAEMLTEGQRLTESSDDGISKVRGLLVLAEVTASLYSDRGFETMKAAVEAINRAGNIVSLNGGRAVSTSELSTLNTQGAISPLARADFERTVQLVKALDKKELSTLALLVACRETLRTSSEKKMQSESNK